MFPTAVSPERRFPGRRPDPGPAGPVLPETGASLGEVALYRGRGRRGLPVGYGGWPGARHAVLGRKRGRGQPPESPETSPEIGAGPPPERRILGENRPPERAGPAPGKGRAGPWGRLYMQKPESPNRPIAIFVYVLLNNSRILVAKCKYKYTTKGIRQ